MRSIGWHSLGAISYNSLQYMRGGGSAYFYRKTRTSSRTFQCDFMHTLECSQKELDKKAYKSTIYDILPVLIS